jgi:hypothetical protein
MPPESAIHWTGQIKLVAKPSGWLDHTELDKPLFLASNGVILYPEQSAATGIRSM